MISIKDTILQRIENCLVAEAMVRDLPKEKFTFGLALWANLTMRRLGPNHCGSAACFGGYVAIHPFFKKRGVLIDSFDGHPFMFGHSSSSMAHELFGDGAMFMPLSGNEDDNEQQAVLNRIRKALANNLSRLEFAS